MAARKFAKTLRRSMLASALTVTPLARALAPAASPRDKKSRSPVSGKAIADARLLSKLRITGGFVIVTARLRK
jgi:hypothetical protein